MKDIHLLGKKIIADKSEIIMNYTPDENWEEKTLFYSEHIA